ncbi:Der1-like family protein [Ceratocystis lukuohia]|uniref:Derlin n=2 Tax=Ceratocystis TaxID=5157 RepID=A0A0F8DMT3_CERFI|nr:Der1-like family protein [Ceratocystis platani]
MAIAPFAKVETVTITATAFGMSILVYTGILPYRWIMFTWFDVLQIPPQIWRLPTSFLLTGSGLGMLFDPFMLYRGLVELEVGNSRFPRREDVVWYLICVSLMTIDKRGLKASLFLFTIPAQLMPYALMLMGFVQDPQSGMYMLPLQISGLLAAHMWDFITRIYPEFGGGRNLLATPGFVSLFTTSPRVLRGGFGRNAAGGGTSGEGGRTVGGSAGRSTGVSYGSGVLPDSWRSRGPGQRLG